MTANLSSAPVRSAAFLHFLDPYLLRVVRSSLSPLPLPPHLSSTVGSVSMIPFASELSGDFSSWDAVAVFALDCWESRRVGCWNFLVC